MVLYKCLDSLTFIVLVLMFFWGSLHLKCISVNNQKCMSIPTLIDLNFDELRYYPFIISLDRGDGCCKIAEEPFW